MFTTNQMFKFWKAGVNLVANLSKEWDMICQQSNSDSNKKYSLQDWKKKSEYSEKDKKPADGHSHYYS